MKPKLPTVLRKKKPLKKKDLVRGNKTSINKKTVTTTTRLFPELKRSRSLRRSSKRSFRRPRRMYWRIRRNKWRNPLRSLRLRWLHNINLQKLKPSLNSAGFRIGRSVSSRNPTRILAPKQMVPLILRKDPVNSKLSPTKSVKMWRRRNKKIFALTTVVKIRPKKARRIPPSQVIGSMKQTSIRNKMLNFKRENRGFSTWSPRVIPQTYTTNRRRLAKRPVRRTQKKFLPPLTRRIKSKHGLKQIKATGMSLRIKKRQFTKKKKSFLRRKRLGLQRTLKKKTYGFKRWKWRFPRWKRFPRIRGWLQPIYWQGTDVVPYRIFRRPRQPFRWRKPWQQKSQKGLRLIRQKSKWGRLLRRSELVTLQNRYIQVYLDFYGLGTVRYLKARALRFRRSATPRSSKLSLALTWFDYQLDITLCRLRVAPTIKIARLLIKRGYVRINGTPIRTPWKRVEVWDLVQITLESDYFFGKYWYSRNKYQRHLYRQPRNRFKHVHPQKLIIPGGFFTRYPRISDLPHFDRLSWREFGRLVLT